jgi:uncharacterized PurR-regulated membrane protein YhhQ (DUF165 family)
MIGLFYLLSIIAANVLVMQFHLVTHFGLTFPAGAYMIGATFTLRDMVQHRYGKRRCWLWMGAASLISVLFAPQIAVASFSAFLVSEGTDWLIYTYTPGSFTKRVILSNLIGTPLDSIVFVLLAFGPVWNAMVGQTVIKIFMGMLVLLAAVLFQRVKEGRRAA